jgi:hypothetical protein
MGSQQRGTSTSRDSTQIIEVIFRAVEESADWWRKAVLLAKIVMSDAYQGGLRE